jgi:prepilin-type N-terminal cleavage/methylation domain-containing protein
VRPARGKSLIADAEINRGRCLNTHYDFAIRGFSLVEVLVAMMLIAVALVPAMQALQSGVEAAKIDLEFTQQAPTAKMEQVMARSFASLALAATGGLTTSSANSTTRIAYDPTVTLGFPLSAPLVTNVPIPAGPGFSDAEHDVFIDCINPSSGNSITSGACLNLLRIRVVSRITGQQLVSYKAQ